MLGDNGIHLKGPHFYEPAVRVPLIISHPGTIPAGVETDALVELVDLAPTLLDATRRSPSSAMQGRSLWPFLIGDREDGGRESVYCEHYTGMPWQDESISPFATMVRTDQYKLVKMHQLGTGELYDLKNDPTETHNRWADDDFTTVKATLLDLLSDRMAETVDPLPERQAPW